MVSFPGTPGPHQLLVHWTLGSILNGIEICAQWDRCFVTGAQIQGLSQELSCCSFSSWVAKAWSVCGFLLAGRESIQTYLLIVLQTCKGHPGHWCPPHLVPWGSGELSQPGESPVGWVTWLRGPYLGHPCPKTIGCDACDII